MTSRASVGFFALMDREVATNQGFINIVPRDERMRMYLLFNLMSRVAEIRGNAKGTTYPEISKGRFRAMDILIPEAALLQKFSDTTSEIVRQVGLLKRSTLQLGQARDLLLPRLMNGSSDHDFGPRLRARPARPRPVRDRADQEGRENLLRTLKAEKLRVDQWREKDETRSAVKVAIHDFLYSDETGLPATAYSVDDVATTSEAVFAHVYRAYPTVPSPYYDGTAAA